VFKTVPPVVQRLNFVHCFNGERRKVNKGNKGIKQFYKRGEECKYRISNYPLNFNVSSPRVTLNVMSVPLEVDLTICYQLC
jgi:hypothetical protein